MISRNSVALEALDWIDTPYVLRGQIKHVGVDCGTLLICVYRNCGLEILPAHEFTSHDWWSNASDERYLRHLMKYCRKLIEGQCFRCLNAQSGDILTVRAAQSKFFNHAAIVTCWPKAVHAIAPRVAEIDVTRDPMWATELVQVWSPF